MILLTGLYLNESKKGEKYFKGRLGTGDILIYKNKKKSQEKDPDYYLYLAEKVDKDKGASGEDTSTDGL